MTTVRLQDTQVNTKSWMHHQWLKLVILWLPNLNYMLIGHSMPITNILIICHMKSLMLSYKLYVYFTFISFCSWAVKYAHEYCNKLLTGKSKHRVRWLRTQAHNLTILHYTLQSRQKIGDKGQPWVEHLFMYIAQKSHTTVNMLQWINNFLT